MKRIFWLLSFVLCLSVSNTFAQNWYGKVGVGFDVALRNGMNTNQTINGYVGYFFDAHQALELDLTHGFEKDNMFYNRIGANYLFEFQTCDSMSPYIKFGGGYKNVGFDVMNETIHEEFVDFKLGFGFHYYIDTNWSINMGIDFTNMANDNYDFSWRNTMLQTHISLSYNF